MVNGRPIPFDMKIGEAGEAFFVFETSADVPEDLITSPILEATQVGESNASVQAGKFGAKEEADEPETLELDPPGEPPNREPSPQPDKFDYPRPGSQDHPPTESQKQAVGPSDLLRAGGGLGKAVVRAVMETEREAQDRLRDRLAVAENIAKHTNFPCSSAGDEVLPRMDSAEAQPNQVVYKGGAYIFTSGITSRDLNPLFSPADVVIDYDGYHNRNASSHTVTPDDDVANTPGTEPTPDISSAAFLLKPLLHLLTR
jgi:phosphatidate phosphatase LPIN